MHRSAQNGILGMRVAGGHARGSSCIEYDAWLKVAGGLLADSETKELTAHAAQCGYCGPLLRKAAETLSDDATANEEELLSKLSSARPEQQQQIAQMLRGVMPKTSVPKAKAAWWPRFSFDWRPMLVGATLATAVIVGWLGWREPQPPSAEVLLAQAYKQQRPFDARIPDAQFGPPRGERSPRKSDFDGRTGLSQAVDIIEQNLAKHPNDPTWLQASARADLLDNHYESAIETLQRALEIEPDSPKLLTDLGIAYLFSAESKDSAGTSNSAQDEKEKAAVQLDYAHATDVLTRVLTRDPGNGIALFNRALALEGQKLYDLAIKDWDQYLLVDPYGDWSHDALRLRARVKSEQEARQKLLNENLLRPEEIDRRPIGDLRVEAQIDRRIEEYLKEALTNWLPAAYPMPPDPQSSAAKKALSLLAGITGDPQRHNDAWLGDLLRNSSGGQFPVAVQALASAIKRDKDGCYADAQHLAHGATQLFHAAGNPAGEARAEAEEVYADQLLWEGERCLALEQRVEQQLQGHNWGWIQGQMSLEKSNCANQVGDLGTYQTALIRGVREAEAHNYTSLQLRGMGFQALAAASMGDAQSALSLSAEGLQRFWSGQGDLMNGYNLYANLDPAAEDLQLTNLQVMLWQQATELIDHHPDILLRAMAHLWYGKAAYRANLPDVAAAQFRQAGTLIKASETSTAYKEQCHDTEATTRDLMDAEVWLANAEIQKNDLRAAAATLREIKPDLAKAPSFDPEIGYYSAQADIAMLAGGTDVVASKQAIQSAIVLAERALASFSTEDDRRRWAEKTRRTYRDAVEWELRQGDSSAALELWEWYRGAEFRLENTVASHPISNPGVDASPHANDLLQLKAHDVVANRWPRLSEETDVTYVVFAKGIEVWVYDNRGVWSRWIPIAPTKIQNMALQFERLCADRTSDLRVLRLGGDAIYKALIGSIEDRLLPGRTLVIEPDDFLEGIPWEALVDGKGEYLAAKFAVVVSPGLYRALHLRAQSAITRLTPALVVSVSAVPEEGVAPLPDAESEAEAVANRFSGAHWLQDGDATLSGIQQQIRDAAVFHFAGHATVSPDRSGLMLAEIDGKGQRPRVVDGESFTPAQTRDLQLVVLSACHTGAEPSLGVSGTEGLAQTFLHDQVPHVIVSRWNIDSSKTADFMKQFYAGVLGGNSVAGALHTAQIALASQPASAHPYYWAAFELEGTR